jgi:hypothetical protein
MGRGRATFSPCRTCASFHLIETRDGQDAVTVRCEPRVGTPEANWPKVAEAVAREVSSALEVKVNVDLRPYGTVTREFKAKRIHDMRKAG